MRACKQTSHPALCPSCAANYPWHAPYLPQVGGEKVDSAEMRVAAALAQEEAARAQVALLQQRLRDKTATMLGGAAREAALKEQLADLQAMVEVSLGAECIQCKPGMLVQVRLLLTLSTLNAWSASCQESPCVWFLLPVDLIVSSWQMCSGPTAQHPADA